MQVELQKKIGGWGHVLNHCFETIHAKEVMNFPSKSDNKPLDWIIQTTKSYTEIFKL